MIPRWESYWFGPVAAVRPYLFAKCFLLLVGSDALLLMTERGARYGLDGFNVAHFPWLDAIQPLPTATYYVGVLMGVVLLAFGMALGGTCRIGLVALALLYTYSWAMSRMDSYLHHYMATLILTCLIFFPPLRAADVIPRGAYGVVMGRPGRTRPAGRRRAGWGTSRRWWVLTLAFWLAAVVFLVQPKIRESWLGAGALVAVGAGLTWAAWRRQPLGEVPRTSAWGFRLLGATVGVIYIFTSMAKMDAEWCAGHTIKQVGNVTTVLAPVERLAAAVGISPSWFWSILATTVIPLELTIAASYFAAVRQDEPPRRWTRRFTLLGWCAATGLHLNNEMMGLSIQWFSYYMIFLATFFLLPAGILARFGMVLLLPASWCEAKFQARTGRLSPAQAWAALPVALVAMGGSTGGAILRLDIPGATWGLALGGAVALFAVLLLHTVGWPRRALRMAIAVVASAVLIHTATIFSDLRFDYYDLLGRTTQRLVAVEALPNVPSASEAVHPFVERQRQALAAFEKALSFLPEDDPRRALVYTNMGLAYRRLAQIHHVSGLAEDAQACFAKTVECYRRAVAVDPAFALAYYNLGVALQYVGRSDDALNAYRQALAIKPDLSDAMVNMALILEQQGKLSEALELYQAAARIERTSSDISQFISRVQRELVPLPHSNK